MATFVTNTPLPCDSSTPAVHCAAHELNAEQRQQLALQALAGTEPITELARRHQVSRQFVYQQAAQGAQALEQAFASPPNDTEVLFYLPVTKAWLRQVVLGLILLCHSSCRGVMAFFHDLLDCPLSLGTVHNIVQEAVTLAQQVNAAQDLCKVRVGSHDELFQAGQPVLAGIDLDSTYCYLLAPVAHRDAETWGIHLLELADILTTPSPTAGAACAPVRRWPGLRCPAMGMCSTACASSPSSAPRWNGARMPPSPGARPWSGRWPRPSIAARAGASPSAWPAPEPARSTPSAWPMKWAP